jgi:hypothetical protein
MTMEAKKVMTRGRRSKSKELAKSDSFVVIAEFEHLADGGLFWRGYNFCG